MRLESLLGFLRAPYSELICCCKYKRSTLGPGAITEKALINKAKLSSAFLLANSDAFVALFLVASDMAS